MRGSSAFIALATLTACTESTPLATHPPPKPSTLPTPVASMPPPLDASAVAEIPITIPDGKPGWKTVPREQNGFYAVLDGLCSKLGFGRVGTDVVVHYGGNSASVYATNERQGEASFIGLRDSGLESIGNPYISSPTGIAGRSLDDFWVADSTGSRSSEGAVLHRRFEGAWKTFAKDQTHIHAWLDGGIIGTGGMARSNGDLWVEGSTTKPPASLWSDIGPFPVLSAFPTGEITLLAHPEMSDWANAPWLARHWSPTKKMTQFPLPMLGVGEWPTIVETAPDELYAFATSTVAQYDGTKWTTLGTTTKKEKIAWAKRAAKGEVWVRLEAGGIERSTPTGFVRVPMPEPIAAIDGIDIGAPWAVGQSGKLYKRVGEAWTEVKLPGPTFGTAPAVKAKAIRVGSADDVLVQAAYWEKGPGWSEQELHHMLFRTKAPKETMRCNEPDPENNNIYMGRGFQSWPPLVSATAECKTPFVVLARRSNSKSKVPAESDWKLIRAALKGKAELGDGKLVEFGSGDRTFLGAKAKDVESAKKIAALATAKDRVRPEVVCGEPPTTTRDIPLE